ncbi:MAG: cystathionine beta-lyase [Alphaproteobacteria bacterium]
MAKKKGGRRHRTATRLVTGGRDIEAQQGFVNPPVYRGSTVLFPTLAELESDIGDRYNKVVYGRWGTPTHFALQSAVAELEGGHHAIAFGSGKAAILAALISFLEAGDHLLMVDSVYGPTRTICTDFLARYGVETTFYDPLIGDAISNLMRANTRLVFVESPGSLTFEVQDVPALAQAAHDAGAVVIMDNTWATPLYFKPFAHGVDVSIQAATKYIVGHSDAMLGLVTANEASYERIKSGADDLGAPPGPDDCYLALRGLRTLGVRLERHQATGLTLARWLAKRPEVARVLHPALPDDPGHALWKRDFTGASGLFGVILKGGSDDALAALLDGLELFGMGYSWGGFESLAIPTHPEIRRTASAWQPPGLTLRFHAGLEDADDLIGDLERGFERFNRAT